MSCDQNCFCLTAIFIVYYYWSKTSKPLLIPFHPLICSTKSRRSMPTQAKHKSCSNNPTECYVLCLGSIVKHWFNYRWKVVVWRKSAASGYILCVWLLCALRFWNNIYLTAKTVINKNKTKKCNRNCHEKTHWQYSSFVWTQIYPSFIITENSPASISGSRYPEMRRQNNLPVFRFFFPIKRYIHSNVLVSKRCFWKKLVLTTAAFIK